MPRNIDATTLTAANQESIYPIQLIKFQLSEIFAPNPSSNPEGTDESLYLSTCYTPIKYDDGSFSDDPIPVANGEKTYIAGAGVVSLSAFEETQDIKTNAISIQLNGVPNTIIAALETVEAIGGKVTIYQAFWNEENNNIDGFVYQKWSGLINSHSTDEENQERGNVRITVECKNLLGSILNTKGGRYTSRNSFRSLPRITGNPVNANDESMEFVASLVNFNPKFGAEE